MCSHESECERCVTIQLYVLEGSQGVMSECGCISMCCANKNGLKKQWHMIPYVLGASQGARSECVCVFLCVLPTRMA